MVLKCCASCWKPFLFQRINSYDERGVGSSPNVCLALLVSVLCFHFFRQFSLHTGTKVDTISFYVYKSQFVWFLGDSCPPSTHNLGIP